MIFQKLIQDALSQGTTPFLMKFLNFAVIALILVLGFVTFKGYGDIHVSIMLFLATGLLVSANWWAFLVPVSCVGFRMGCFDDLLRVWSLELAQVLLRVDQSQSDGCGGARGWHGRGQSQT
jgi:hypothetical protein